jgi:type II secretory pathway component PulJ
LTLMELMVTSVLFVGLTLIAGHMWFQSIRVEQDVVAEAMDYQEVTELLTRMRRDIGSAIVIEFPANGSSVSFSSGEIGQALVVFVEDQNTSNPADDDVFEYTFNEDVVTWNQYSNDRLNWPAGAGSPEQTFTFGRGNVTSLSVNRAGFNTIEVVIAAQGSGIGSPGIQQQTQFTALGLPGVDPNG